MSLQKRGDRILALLAVVSVAVIAAQSAISVFRQMVPGYWYWFDALIAVAFVVAAIEYAISGGLIVALFIPERRGGAGQRRRHIVDPALMRAVVGRRGAAPDAVPGAASGAVPGAASGAAQGDAVIAPGAAPGAVPGAVPGAGHALQNGMQLIEVAIKNLAEARSAVANAARQMGMEAAEEGGKFFIYDPSGRRKTYRVNFKMKRRRRFWGRR